MVRCHIAMSMTIRWWVSPMLLILTAWHLFWRTEPNYKSLGRFIERHGITYRLKTHTSPEVQHVQRIDALRVCAELDARTVSISDDARAAYRRR